MVGTWQFTVVAHWQSQNSHLHCVPKNHPGHY